MKVPSKPTTNETLISAVKAHLGVDCLTRDKIRPIAYTEEFHAIVERVYGTRNRHSLQLGWASLLKATDGTDGAS